MDQETDIQYKIAQIKLQRVQELNIKLKESLLRERLPTSQSSLSIINYTLETPDYLIPVIWKLNPEQNKYQRYQIYKNTRKLKFKGKNGDGGSNCCTIV